MPSAEVADAIASFWGSASPPGPPYNVLSHIPLAVETSIDYLSNLSVADIGLWMQTRGLPAPTVSANRRLYGCLIATSGVGFMLIDARASLAEQQFTAAHELGHFLLDYLQPRARAIAKFGPSMTSVLDGERAPTQAERRDAVLTNVRLGAFLTLMERSAEGTMSLATHHAEMRADQFALAILAPAQQVLSRLRLPSRASYSSCLTATQKLLVADYALPSRIAQAYAADLLALLGKQSGLIDRLFNS